MARAWHLVARPRGLPALTDMALVVQPDAPLGEGDVRVRNRWLSVDPYMRGRMNDGPSYVPAFALDSPMEGGAIGEVVESRSPDHKPGDMVLHMLGWRDIAQGPAAAFRRLPPIAAPEQRFLGDLGMTGMTAWFGLLAVGAAKAGETLFVSGAAGAVGSAVVQIARAKGLTVIGSAGGPDKVAHVRALGADHAIDYREGDLVRALGRAAPNGIDVYFDNVGGDHLDAAFAHARQDARFAICGMIEIYNALKPTSLAYLGRVIAARVRMQGFIVFDFIARANEFYTGMAELHAKGDWQSHETIRDGLEAAPQAFLDLFSGGNTGKMLVRL